MVESRLTKGKLLMHRTAEEREPLVRRLNRIEGQVRGLRAMIEQDRYCADELQQVKAAIAALREVGLAIVEQHVAASVEHVATADGSDLREDVMRVLREAIRL